MLIESPSPGGAFLLDETSITLDEPVNMRGFPRFLTIGTGLAGR
jgi:hypothetical protein